MVFCGVWVFDLVDKKDEKELKRVVRRPKLDFVSMSLRSQGRGEPWLRDQDLEYAILGKKYEGMYDEVKVLSKLIKK